MLKKILKNHQPNFCHYVKEIEAQAKKRVFVYKKVHCFSLTYTTLTFLFMQKYALPFPLLTNSLFFNLKA